MKNSFFIILCIFSINHTLYSQIIVDNNPPNSDIVYLVDNVLLSSNLQTSNHSFEGDPLQIAYFNGANSNIGFEGGIVIGTGDISVLNPTVVMESNVAFNPGDDDLLTIANSVPNLIDQVFSVAGVNDVAAIDFDFVATSDSLSFRYVFASQEYNSFENSNFNDVFGFFVSGPGITGPYSSPAAFPDGSINIATFISEEDNSLDVELPITVSSINSNYNSQFYVDNQSLETVGRADGFTVVMTAQAIVQCGETYHIRLAIADGTDSGQSSFILLEENSFATNNLSIGNNVGISQDSSVIEVKCGAKVTLTAQLSSDEDYDILWSNNANSNSIIVGEGTYSFQAINGNCIQYSDSIRIDETPIQVDLGDDISVCERELTTLSLKSVDGTFPYTYNWSTSESTEEISVSSGTYNLEVTDVNGCKGSDEIIIHPIARPSATISGSGNICEGQSENFPILNVQFYGVPPFYCNYYDGTNITTDTSYSFASNLVADHKGNYSIISLKDSNCTGDPTTAVTITYSSSSSLLTGGELICEGDSTLITIKNVVDAPPYSLYFNNGSYNQVFESLTQLEFQIYVQDSAIYSIDKIVDRFGCISVKNEGLAYVNIKEHVMPLFTTMIDTILCPVDPPILLEAVPEGGVFSGKGVDFDGFFNPINSFLGKNWVYYSFPENCNEIDSLDIEIGCQAQILIPNSFTPNDDSNNDYLEVRGNNILTFEMSIFNRWGALIFHTDDMSKFWDGKYKNNVVPNGVYTYSLLAYGKDAKHIHKAGYVNIIR